MILIKCFLLMQLSFADNYKVPNNVLEARDESLKSLDRFKNTILTRYFLLKSKRTRTMAEEREMVGLNAVIYNEDLGKSEKLLDDLYKPTNDFKIQGNIE